MSFKIGDRVRCINAPTSSGILVDGFVYTVTGTEESYDPPRLILKELSGYAWRPQRFELMRTRFSRNLPDWF